MKWFPLEDIFKQKLNVIFIYYLRYLNKKKINFSKKIRMSEEKTTKEQR